jgi:hypothetical protein
MRRTEKKRWSGKNADQNPADCRQKKSLPRGDEERIVTGRKAESERHANKSRQQRRLQKGGPAGIF